MIIGVPKEVKVREYRVGMVPAGVRRLTKQRRGHTVIVETGAGVGSGIPDQHYIDAGAEIVPDIATVYERADMIVKVKEPIRLEYDLIRENQILYTYLHLAAEPRLAEVLMQKKCIAFAYETIELPDHSLPLLKPMSEVAGRMSIQVGADVLKKENGGKGILLGGVPGVRRGRVAIIGAGVVGRNAAKIAVGLGAEVTVLDLNLQTLDYIDDIFHGQVQTLFSDDETIRRSVREADLLVGAVLIHGARAPKLVSEELISEMDEGSVVVDVSVDQGGCIETIHATTHDDPTFVVHGVVHYGVANMPGAVSQTSTFALTNTTIGYAAIIADLGAEEAVKRDPALALGLNVYKGEITSRPVASSLNLECAAVAELVH